MRQIQRKLSILDVKQAIYDERFQKLFPELKEDIDKIIKDPTCSCNRSMYLKFFAYKDRLEKFFPNRIIDSVEEEVVKLSQNHWLVINCKINELEDKLRQLPPGNKQIAVARYEDQVTVVVNNLGVTQ
jgi:predicted nuclease of restriction endonuclease-like (RecB) superfamily